MYILKYSTKSNEILELSASNKSVFFFNCEFLPTFETNYFSLLNLQFETLTLLTGIGRYCYYEIQTSLFFIK